ncbi:MAG: hypothetical protein HKN85_00745 [Gammaproteobacteria bacterium]|nr:hypothetical protein [Gammaproteobacteria bacterium]
MAKLTNNYQQISEDRLLGIKRFDVPCTAQLEEKILQLSAGMPQARENLKGDIGQKQRPWSGFFPGLIALIKGAEHSAGNKTISGFFNPFAARLAAGVTITALVLTIIVGIPVTPVPENSADEIYASGYEQIGQELLWQDLMLMQDELAFAEL